MSKHTPIPWRIFCGAEGDFIGDKDKECIITIDDDTISDDAKFIVRAVNCHDELVAALETMIARLDCRKKWEDPDREAYHAARSALARATGE